MIRIAITETAFAAITSTFRSSSVGYENETNERGERLIWLKDAMADLPIPSLGDGVMLGTAWIDRPVDTQGRAPASTSSSARGMEARPCSSQ
jgi:hypothetical protein